MIEIEKQRHQSVPSDVDARVHWKRDESIRNTPFRESKGALGIAGGYVEGGACPSQRESPCNIQGRYNRARKPTKRVRIQTKLCLAMAMLCLNPNTTRAFPRDFLSRQRLKHISSLANTSPVWKECTRFTRFPFTVGMTQSKDITSENADNQEEDDENEHQKGDISIEDFRKLKSDYKKRISRLEDIVSRQEVELHRLKSTCAELSEVSLAFGKLLGLLREAGLAVENYDSKEISSEEELGVEDSPPTKEIIEASIGKVIESYDDALIFGTAPSSVIDAADSAGAAILAAMLGGKQRMLVDVRDAELSNDPETLVQFIELAILPIAAGLEGLKSTRNRVKIVFPKVSQLLEYRRTMALAAPEVVALSTLGFDPVEKRDKLVVIVAPEPDDEEGIQAIRDLLTPNEEGVRAIEQPVVVLNYHMLPFSGVDVKFETAYHLRLLSVQYMADPNIEEFDDEPADVDTELEAINEDEFEEDSEGESTDVDSVKADDLEETVSDDEALESAMKHAHEVGVNQGVTRAMVIRAFPRPWHIFVDMSPNTNADFEVAATFDKEPTMEELNYAIVECLEGSEREDEIVEQQMQQALEEGQLNKVSELLSGYFEDYIEDLDPSLDEEDEDDDFDMFEEDSV